MEFEETEFKIGDLFKQNEEHPGHSIRNNEITHYHLINKREINMYGDLVCLRIEIKEDGIEIRENYPTISSNEERKLIGHDFIGNVKGMKIKDLGVIIDD